MATDKGFFDLAHESPEAILELAGFPSQTIYQPIRPVFLKDLDREIDNLFLPNDLTQPAFFLEFHGYKKPTLLIDVLHKQFLFLLNQKKAFTTPVNHVIVFTKSSYYHCCYPLPKTQGHNITPRIVIMEYFLAHRLPNLRFEELEALFMGKQNLLRDTTIGHQLMEEGRKKGEKKGEKKAIQEIVRKMYALDQPISLISESTGLTEQQIQKILDSQEAER